jgi:hypothetical protein
MHATVSRTSVFRAIQHLIQLLPLLLAGRFTLPPPPNLSHRSTPAGASHNAESLVASPSANGALVWSLGTKLARRVRLPSYTGSEVRSLIGPLGLSLLPSSPSANGALVWSLVPWYGVGA